MRLNEKVAVITGGHSGIGRAIADCFVAQGAIVVIAARSEDRITQAVQEIKAAGGRAIGYRTDVSQQEQTRTLMDKVAAECGRIDILVNNAGITRYRPFASMTGEDWDMVLGVDLKGVFFCSQAAAPHMIHQHYGRIVNISSAAGTGSTPGASAGSPGATAPYAASKAAVNMLTKTLARELGPHGVTVNCVAPGTFPTAISTSTRTPEQLAEHLENRKKATVLQRIGTLDEVATSVLFFATDDSSYITGQTLCVDGGRFDRM
jgi:NAD(P)-dependent dehydrogenase (short-subunit alcohol dehydrogenase family)